MSIRRIAGRLLTGCVLGLTATLLVYYGGWIVFPVGVVLFGLSAWAFIKFFSALTQALAERYPKW